MADSGFSKVLSRRDVLALSFGAMIGWSWVLLTGDWLLRAGTMGTLCAFGAGGTIILIISLTYAELVAAMPKAGGEHVYTQRALGKTLSFVCTWSLVMGYVAVPVFESSALPTALEYLFPRLKAGLLWRVAGADVYCGLTVVGIIAALWMTWINYIGIETAAFVQTLITTLFFLVGVMFFTGSLGPVDSEKLEPLWVDGGTGFLSVLIMVPALMVGFDVIPQSAEEIDVEPPLIGRILVVSVVLAVLWYALITLGVAITMTPSMLKSATMATAEANAIVWGGGWAGDLMVIAGIGGILTSWNAFIVGGSRVIFA
ncbi:MAG: APC family permease, partial [Gammaproteobacteria bacterium]